MSSEIPHHVSSFEMIDSLMDSMATLLKSLPKPTLITTARYVIVAFLLCIQRCAVICAVMMCSNIMKNAKFLQYFLSDLGPTCSK